MHQSRTGRLPLRAAPDGRRANITIGGSLFGSLYGDIKSGPHPFRPRHTQSVTMNVTRPTDISGHFRSSAVEHRSFRRPWQRPARSSPVCSLPLGTSRSFEAVRLGLHCRRRMRKPSDVDQPSMALLKTAHLAQDDVSLSRARRQRAGDVNELFVAHIVLDRIPSLPGSPASSAAARRRRRRGRVEKLLEPGSRGRRLATAPEDRQRRQQRTRRPGSVDAGLRDKYHIAAHAFTTFDRSACYYMNQFGSASRRR